MSMRGSGSRGRKSFLQYKVQVQIQYVSHLTVWYKIIEIGTTFSFPFDQRMSLDIG